MNFTGLAKLFATVGIPIPLSRQASDTTSSARVAVIPQSIAANYWGPRARWSAPDLHAGAEQRPAVVKLRASGDVERPRLTTTLQVYAPAAQHAYFGSLTMVVRSASGPMPSPPPCAAQLLGSTRRARSSRRARCRRSWTRPGPRRRTATLLGLFAGMALLPRSSAPRRRLVHGRPAHAGDRIPQPGAPRGRVIALVFRQGAACSPGAVGGTIGAIWVARCSAPSCLVVGAGRHRGLSPWPRSCWSSRSACLLGPPGGHRVDP
jgi:hypothetical protein